MVNLCFTIIYDENCNWWSKHFAISFGEIQETYEDLSEPITYLIENIKNLNTKNYKEKIFKIVYYFAGDLKILLIIQELRLQTVNFPVYIVILLKRNCI